MARWPSRRPHAKSFLAFLESILFPRNGRHISLCSPQEEVPLFYRTATTRATQLRLAAADDTEGRREGPRSNFHATSRSGVRGTQQDDMARVCVAIRIITLRTERRIFLIIFLMNLLTLHTAAVGTRNTVGSRNSFLRSKPTFNHVSTTHFARMYITYERPRCKSLAAHGCKFACKAITRRVEQRPAVKKTSCKQTLEPTWYKDIKYTYTWTPRFSPLQS